MLNSLVNFNHFTDYIGKSLLIVKLKNVVNIRTAKVAVDKENSFSIFEKEIARFAETVLLPSPFE